MDSSTKPRVIILSGSMPATTFIDGLTNAMAEEGYPVIVTGRKDGAYTYHKNVEVIEVPTSTTGRLWFLFKGVFKIKLKDLLLIVRNRKSFKLLYSDLLYYMPLLLAKADILHVQWATFITKRDLIFDFFKDRVILSLRGTHINYTPVVKPKIAEAYRRKFPKVWRYHSVSDAIADKASLYGADRSKIKTIYSYVNEEVLNAEIEPKQRTGKLKIISVGRFFWNKGYSYAFDAIYKLKQTGLDFQYDLIAKGEVPESVIFQLRQMGIEDRVNIINGLPHKEVLTAIKGADVMLLPSIDEGIANVVLEAMAVGTVAVSTDCGGMEEVIEDGVSGYVVKIRDAEAMATAIQQVAAMSNNAYYNMALKAKERIKTHHNVSVFKQGFKDLYQI